MSTPASTPRPPYFAVIFTSVRRAIPDDGYGEMAERMERLAAQQPGYLGIESARGPDGLGITVSYWESAEAAAAWGRNAEHRLAQQFGREKWYQRFTLRACRAEHAFSFERPEDHR